MIIDSGLGNGFQASVNNLNKLEVRSINEEIFAAHVRGGHGFNIRTATINIDDADSNAILYFKNTGEDDFIITSYGIMLGTSTGGSGGEWIFDSVRNPTGGTLVSAGTANTPVNFNTGSAKTLSADVFESSAANQTLTGQDADPFLTTLGTGTGLQLVNVVPIPIPQGNSIGLKFQAQPSNTSQNVRAFIVGYRSSLITTEVIEG